MGDAVEGGVGEGNPTGYGGRGREHRLDSHLTIPRPCALRLPPLGPVWAQNMKTRSDARRGGRRGTARSLAPLHSADPGRSPAVRPREDTEGVPGNSGDPARPPQKHTGEGSVPPRPLRSPGAEGGSGRRVPGVGASGNGAGRSGRPGAPGPRGGRTHPDRRAAPRRAAAAGEGAGRGQEEGGERLVPAARRGACCFLRGMMLLRRLPPPRRRCRAQERGGGARGGGARAGSQPPPRAAARRMPLRPGSPRSAAIPNVRRREGGREEERGGALPAEWEV